MYRNSSQERRFIQVEVHTRLTSYYNWIISLKPKDVRDKGISERELKRKKAEIRKGKRLNFKTKVNKTLLKLYKARQTNS
ncbi:MAG: hypothetical protein ACP5UZ_06855, partial [Thermoplasmata archaeon]